MKLKSAKLSDVTLTPVETRSRTKMFRVDLGRCKMGFVEQLGTQAKETFPWKAYRNVARGSFYLDAFFEDEGGLDAAVACVLERTL